MDSIKDKINLLLFDKLVNELQSIDRLEFNGDLVNPNHFRIITTNESVLEIIKTLKKYQFNLLNIIKFENLQNSEYLFQSNNAGRIFIVSIVINQKTDFNSAEISFNDIFPEISIIEKYFKSVLS